MNKKTKMICTIGPSSANKSLLVKMIKAGMSCARINFSHGSYESLQEIIDTVKEARKEAKTLLPILLDTKGPEIRVKDFKDGSIVLKKGQTFILDDDEKTLGDENRIGLTYHDLAKVVKKNTTIMIDDGKIKLKVIGTKGKEVITKVLNGGKVSNHKSINVPNLDIPMPFLSRKDKEDLLFGIKNDVDFVAASFTRTKQDAKDIRKFLDDNGGSDIQIIAKIENGQGIKNFDQILEIVDGIMVARGDLGVEIPFPYIPGLQKAMIDHANAKGKIAIVATQMLESMTENPRPTRAEVSDVANAVYDGATATMLSGESASGKYPLEAVSTMADIAATSENSEKYIADLARKTTLNLGTDTTQSICKAAYEAAEYINAKGIVAFTISGYTAIKIASYRPNVPIIALCCTEKAARQLNLRYNVFPILTKQSNDLVKTMIIHREEVISLTKGKKGDRYIIISGSNLTKGHTDMMGVYALED